MLERLERMPVPVLPTMVGVLTLSNVFNGFGFAWLRHMAMWAAVVVGKSRNNHRRPRKSAGAE